MSNESENIKHSKIKTIKTKDNKNLTINRRHNPRDNKLFVVVPQAIGISLRNRIGDSNGEFLVVVLWGFLSTFNVLELLLFLYF